MRPENKGLHEPAEFGKKHDTKTPTSDRLDFCSYLFAIMAAEQAGFATGAVLPSKKKKKKAATFVFFTFHKIIWGYFLSRSKICFFYTSLKNIKIFSRGVQQA